MKGLRLDIACRAVVCPSCSAQAGQPCSAVNRHNDRRPVRWAHQSRQRLWEQQQEGEQ